MKDYEAVFNEWEDEGFVEKVELGEQLKCNIHYLPHKAVIKLTSTTEIRPVFEGSEHVTVSVYINDCIEKRSN